MKLTSCLNGLSKEENIFELLPNSNYFPQEIKAKTVRTLVAEQNLSTEVGASYWQTPCGFGCFTFFCLYYLMNTTLENTVISWKFS